ncbi:hypothetical protein AB0H00_27645 [Nocardia sp. NPDC023852]
MSARLLGFPTRVRPPLTAASSEQIREIHTVVGSLLPQLAGDPAER